jgi:hypothetical protein
LLCVIDYVRIRTQIIESIEEKTEEPAAAASSKPMPIVILPQLIEVKEKINGTDKSRDVWSWNGIAVNRCPDIPGFGLCATQELAAGTVIPYWGAYIHRANPIHSEHYFLVIDDGNHLYLDGDPKIAPYNNVGGNGGWITSMANGSAMLCLSVLLIYTIQ